MEAENERKQETCKGTSRPEKEEEGQKVVEENSREKVINRNIFRLHQTSILLPLLLFLPFLCEQPFQR